MIETAYLSADEAASQIAYPRQTVIEMNQQAARQLNVTYRMEIIPGAPHPFEEPGTLDQVARLASEWFVKYLVKTA